MGIRSSTKISMNPMELASEIRRLKKEKNILLLAHYYQIP